MLSHSSYILWSSPSDLDRKESDGRDPLQGVAQHAHRGVVSAFFMHGPRTVVCRVVASAVGTGGSSRFRRKDDFSKKKFVETSKLNTTVVRRFANR